MPVNRQFQTRALVVALTCVLASSGIALAGPAAEQQTFATPEDALKALVTATKSRDRDALRKIFGPDAKDLANPDRVEAASDMDAFVKAVTERANLSRENDATVTIVVGGENWPFPIPLVKEGDKWFFDTKAGQEEILDRRIGENELNAISVCRSYVTAQREYAADDRDGDDIFEFAQKFISDSGQKNGLYWETKPDEPPSPLGPAVAAARSEGYLSKDKLEQRAAPQPFHGYFFKILTRQGDKAPGGKYDYVINGNMVAGFALVAYPAQWGNSGVMTFVVNQRGKVYQKDLGEKTGELAPAITEYNPDNTWTLVKD